MEKEIEKPLSSGGLVNSIEQQDHSITEHTVLMEPVSKLDADQYTAEDIDGVTESVFGSGNLNFLLMQGSQTNEMAVTNDPFAVMGEAPGSSGNSFSGLLFTSGLTTSENFFGPSDQRIDTNTDRSLADDGNRGFEDSGFGGNGGNIANAALTSLGASGFATSGISGTPFNGTDGTNGFDGESTSGNDGRNGINGTNGGDGDGTTIINVDLDIDFGDLTIIDLGDVTNLLTTTITEITNIVNNITDTLNLTEIINNTTNIVNSVINNLFGGNGGLTLQLDAVLGEVSDLNLDVITGDTAMNLINEVVDLSPVTNLLDPILGTENLIPVDLHSVISLLNGPVSHQPGDTDLDLGLITNIGGIDALNGVVDVVFNPVEDLVGDIDVLGDIGINLGQYDNSAGDTDLSLGGDIDLLDSDLLNVPDVDINLDIVENILGDIDVDLGAATDLLGSNTDGLIDSLTGGTGDDSLLSDIGGLLGEEGNNLVDSLLPGLDAGDGSTAPDVVAGGDINLLGQDILDLNESQPLDVIEPLAGDVDLGLNTGLDLLGEADNSPEDTDLTVDLDIDALGLELPDIDFIDVPLDPVEDILGDIDLDINGAIDLLNANTNDGGVGDLIGGNEPGDDLGGLLSWPENILPDAGDIGGGAGDALGDALGSILPEPVGDVAQGLGGLLGGSLGGGGGGGGGHHGGLFGGLFG